MRIFAAGVLFIALAFCGLGDKIEEMQSVIEHEVTKKTDGPPTAEGLEVETPILTPEQQKILSSGVARKWEEQDITWTIPQTWRSIDVGKETFSYGSPDNAFLIVTISPMPADFPSEMSLKAVYDTNLEKMEQGANESLRWLEIDGVKGVELIESPAEDSEDSRRQLWIAFRTHQGQNQQINIILSTKSSGFDKQRDTFAAILYSMKF